MKLSHVTFIFSFSLCFYLGVFHSKLVFLQSVPSMCIHGTVHACVRVCMLACSSIHLCTCL